MLDIIGSEVEMLQRCRASVTVEKLRNYRSDAKGENRN